MRLFSHIFTMRDHLGTRTLLKTKTKKEKTVMQEYMHTVLPLT